MLAAAEDGDPKAISFVQKHGLLESDAYEPEEASADPREGFGGPSRGALGGVFADHGNGRGHGGSHRGQRGNHRGGQRGGAHWGPHSSPNGVLTGGFGPSDAGHSGMEDGEPPEYEAEEQGGDNGPPGVGGGRARGWNSYGNGTQGNGMGHSPASIMGHPGMGPHLPMGLHGSHSRGRGRGRGRGHGQGYLPSAPQGW